VFESTAVPVHTIKAYMGSRRMGPLIFALGTWWKRVVSITSRPL